jgi:hypothetical protein
MSRLWSVATSTPLHCEILARSACRPDGARIRGAGPSAAARTLQAAGLGRFAVILPGGRFLINGAGRAVLHDALAHAEAEAARYLGNANEASESGRADKSPGLMAKCQAWLDAANLLRRAGDDSDTVGLT